MGSNESSSYKYVREIGYVNNPMENVENDDIKMCLSVNQFLKHDVSLLSQLAF